MLTRFVLMVSLATFVVSIDELQKEKAISPEKNDEVYSTVNQTETNSTDINLSDIDSLDSLDRNALCRSVKFHKKLIKEHSKRFLQNQELIKSIGKKTLSLENYTLEDYKTMAIEMIRKQDNVLGEKLTKLYKKQREILQMKDDFVEYGSKNGYLGLELNSAMTLLMILEK